MSNQQARHAADCEAIRQDIAYLLKRIGDVDLGTLQRVELQRIQARLAGIVRDFEL